MTLSISMQIRREAAAQLKAKRFVSNRKHTK